MSFLFFITIVPLAYAEPQSDDAATYAMYLAIKKRCVELVPEYASVYRPERKLLMEILYPEMTREILTSKEKLKSSGLSFKATIQEILKRMRTGELDLEAADCAPEYAGKMLFGNLKN